MTDKQTETKVPKRILRTIALCIVGIFLGINLYMFNAQNIVGNSLPMPFGYGAAVVLSGSMEPELSIDDLIFVKQAEDYEVGDVVVFQDGKELVVHRIVDIEGKFAQTKGDANSTLDTPISVSDIKGKVVASISFVGFVINIIKSPIGIISILALALWLLELSYKKEKSKGEEELEEIRAEIERIKEDMDKSQ